MEETKIINNEELEKVGGGMASAYGALKKKIRGMIPPEVQEKINAAAGDVAVCKILAENGIDVEKVEKKIKDAGFNLNKIGLQELPDDALDKIAGGFETDGTEIRCSCGVSDRSCFSYQIIDTLMSTDKIEAVYRCKNCGMYITKLKDGRVQYYQE